VKCAHANFTLCRNELTFLENCSAYNKPENPGSYKSNRGVIVTLSLSVSVMPWREKGLLIDLLVVLVENICFLIL
jgi:hypothetical protein